MRQQCQAPITFSILPCHSSAVIITINHRTDEIFSYSSRQTLYVLTVLLHWTAFYLTGRHRCILIIIILSAILLFTYKNNSNNNNKYAHKKVHLKFFKGKQQSVVGCRRSMFFRIKLLMKQLCIHL